MRMDVGWVVLAWGLVSSGALGADREKPSGVSWPIQSLLTQDIPQVQKPGRVQASAGVQLHRDPEEGSELEVPMQIALGVAPRLQVQAVLPWRTQAEERGVGNLGLSVDYSLLDSREKHLAASVGMALQLPTMGRGEEERWAFGPRFHVYKDLDWLGVFASVQPRLSFSQDGTASPEALLGAGLAFGKHKVVPTLEAYAELSDEPTFDAVLGVRLKPVKSFELGLGVLAGTQSGHWLWGGMANALVQFGGLEG